MHVAGGCMWYGHDMTGRSTGEILGNKPGCCTGPAPLHSPVPRLHVAPVGEDCGWICWPPQERAWGWIC